MSRHMKRVGDERRVEGRWKSTGNVVWRKMKKSRKRGAEERMDEKRVSPIERVSRIGNEMKGCVSYQKGIVSTGSVCEIACM